MNTKTSIIIALFVLSFNQIIAQQTLNKSMSHNGVTRQYIVYIPAKYDGTSPVPLMFNFHGYTMSANDQMEWGGDMRPVADTAGFILVYPQGTLLGANTHWNVGSWTAESTADDLGYTKAMIDTLAVNYSIDLTRVYSCGYSNGGYLCFELACQLSELIAAVGSVAGTMSVETYNACNPLHPTPIITIHGSADGTVSYYGGSPSNSKSLEEVIAYWVNFNNTNSSAAISNLPDINTTDGSTVEYHKYSHGDSCTSVEHYKVLGGDHDWPGTWGNMDINASAVIWDFVSKYDINGLIDCETTSILGYDYETNEVHLYPNPVSNFVTIDMNLSEDQVYHIYTSTGERIASGVIDSIDRTIDLSGLPSNIYLLAIGGYAVKIIKME